MAAILIAVAVADASRWPRPQGAAALIDHDTGESARAMVRNIQDGNRDHVRVADVMRLIEKLELLTKETA